MYSCRRRARQPRAKEQYEWKNCSIDVSSLFPEGRFAPVGTVLNLYAALSGLSAEREFFLSRRLYVRNEMEQLLREMQMREAARSHIVSGSPGVGKSLVFFLAAIFRAAKEQERVFYFRCTANAQEDASAFSLKKAAKSTQCRFTLLEPSTRRPMILRAASLTMLGLTYHWRVYRQTQTIA